MNRLTLAAVLLLTPTGCLSQFTSRLDRANDHLNDLTAQLKAGNEKLAESSEVLRRMAQQMEEANRKMDRLLKRLGGVDADAAAAPEVPAQAP